MVLSMDRWVGKVAVVTGASSGIGASIAEHLVTAGLKVVGLARSQDRVDALAKKLSDKKGKLYSVKTDMTKEEDVKSAFKWTTENVGPVHILINNAGLAQATTLIDGDFEKWKVIMDTNVLGLCIATREAIQVMKANNIDGHIIHINSGAGHRIPPLPMLNVYPASKYAVTALTETLRIELREAKSKIKITSVSPGRTQSDFSKNAFGAAPIATSQMAEMMKGNAILLAEDVADSVLYALSTPPHVQVHELWIQPIGGI